MPRTYEVYRLMDPQMEAAMPPELREQFHRDDDGRLLWFTSAARDRSALGGVAPQYAGLGHSVGHVAHIDGIREERRQKRKERDEKIAQEMAEKKRVVGGSETEEKRRAKEEEKNKMLELALRGLAEQIERGTVIVEENLEGWEDEKRAWDEERNAVMATKD